MAGGYVFIAGILFYIFLIQKIGSAGLSPLKGTGLLLAGYYTLVAIAVGFEMAARGESVFQVFTVRFFVTLAVQYAIAAGIFYKVEASGDSYLSYAVWGGLGLALIFFVAPRIIGLLLGS